MVQGGVDQSIGTVTAFAAPTPDLDPAQDTAALLPSPRVLLDLCRSAHKTRDPIRRRRVMWLSEIAGQHYGADAATAWTDDKPKDWAATASPINIHQRAVDAILPALAAEHPRCYSDVEFRQWKFYGKTLAAAVNDTVERVGLGHTMNLALLDAYTGPEAVIEVGYVGGSETWKGTDRTHVLGEVFVDRHDPDDYIEDPDAKSPQSVRMQGVRILMTRGEALQAGFGLDDEELMPGEERPPHLATRAEAQDIVSGLETIDQSATNPPEAREIGGTGERRIALDEEIELWKVALHNRPDGQTWIVIMLSGERNEPDGDLYLAAHPYRGRRGGPFRKLAFKPMPNSSQGAALATRYADVHEAAARISRRFARNLASLKRVNIYKREAETTAMRIRKAVNEAWIAVDDPSQVASVDVGGVHKEMPLGMQTVMEWANGSGPNITQIAGRQSGGTDTATQARLIQSNSQVQLRALAGSLGVQGFIREILRDIGWLTHNRPGMRRPVPYQLPSGIVVMVPFESPSVEMEFIEKAIDLEVESLRAPPEPMELMQLLAQSFQQIITPMMPYVQAGIVDGEGLFEMVGNVIGSKALRRIIRTPMLQGEQAMLGQAYMPQGAPGSPGMTALPGPGLSPAGGGLAPMGAGGAAPHHSNGTLNGRMAATGGEGGF